VRAAFLLMLLAACGPGFPEPYIVTDLRVIAMVAREPEVDAGATTTVDVYFFDPDSDGRDTTAFGYVCNDQSSIDCLILNQSPAFQTDAQTAAVVQTDLHVASFPFTVAADFFSGRDALATLYGAQTQLDARGDNGLRHIDAFKRITVASPPLPMSPFPAQPKNTNPTLSGFTLVQDEVPIGDATQVAELNRGQHYTLSPTYDRASLQHYVVLDYQQNPLEFDEEASFTWSCSPACVLSQQVTYVDDTVDIVPPFDGAESQRFSVHLVMRDSRGGEAVFVRTFRLVAAVKVNAR
jgi:hypothetical protein